MLIGLRKLAGAYRNDRAEIELRLHEAGFTTTRRCEIGRSVRDALRGLETRADSTLIVEAHGQRVPKP